MRKNVKTGFSDLQTSFHSIQFYNDTIYISQQYKIQFLQQYNIQF
jgi:hypothetical protein